ncbi:hypothetical protein IDM48_01125 [Rothia amarae]|uniref:Uncharacterized protein n=1 Tax=Rothia amarae TaxID=169480 RepID=A0A7H2BK94_9MICC|nr:hypothetical protein [Rothia amarae]QNV40090.1 hypothetical protein IDM48_01125 [Rothia amarae]
MSTALISNTKRSKFRFKRTKFLYQFLLYLSPVILLTTIFPLVTPRISEVTVGRTQLTEIILAVSITVPWMSQSICLPIYRSMGDLLADREMDACMRRFAEYWLSTCVAVLPVLLVFAAPFYFALNWDFAALFAFLLLGFLNMAFGQLLVIANLPTTNRNTWAFAWLAYALALLLFPTVWFLPPLMGMLVMLFVLRRHLRYLTAFKSLNYSDIAKEMLRGFLLGTVLWADKYVLFIVQGGHMDVVAVYMGLVPAVIAYNYFFAAEATKVDRAVARLRETIQSKGYRQVQSYSAKVETRVVDSTRRTLMVAAVSSAIVALLMFIFVHESFALALAVIVSSWLFLAVTIYSYQVDYLGSHTIPQMIGLAHLLLCIIAFGLVPHTGGYFIIMVGEVVLMMVSYVAFRRIWKAPAYDLFWRHAMAW